MRVLPAGPHSLIDLVVKAVGASVLGVALRHRLNHRRALCVEKVKAKS